MNCHPQCGRMAGAEPVLEPTLWQVGLVPKSLQFSRNKRDRLKSRHSLALTDSGG